MSKQVKQKKCGCGRSETGFCTGLHKLSKEEWEAQQNENKIEEVSETVEPTITLSQKRYEECEWCFQFDNDEPQIFAWTDSEMNKEEEPQVVFTITNVENSYISFTHKSGKEFKIFARELSSEGIELREKQREMLKNMANGSENKEA